MRAIIFSTVKSKVNVLDEVYALKAGYILSDCVVVFGALAVLINAKKDTSKYTLTQKLNLLESNTANDINPAAFDYVQTVKNAYKQFNAIKHPSRETIVSYNLVEKAFHKYFQACLKNMDTYLKSVGLTDMHKLINENIFDIQPLENIISDTGTDTSPNIDLAQLLLNILYPSGNPNDTFILVLPSEFLSNRFTSDEEELMMQDMANTNGIIKNDFMSLTELENLSALEMVALKNQTFTHGITFRGIIDEFIKMNNEVSNSALERKKYIETMLFPQAAKLKARFNENELVQFKKTKQSSNTLTFKLCIGEAPIEHFWNYFGHFSVIDKFTLKYVKEMVASDNKYQSHIPFIGVSTYVTNSEGKEELISIAQKDIMSPKPRKFIAVDD